MPEFSLRELLQCVSEHPNDYFHRYRLFEALVEAVEPEDTDTTIRKLRKRLHDVTRDGLALVQQVREERDEARAETERLRHELSAAADLSYERAQECDADAALLVMGSRMSLAEARKTIEHLRKELTETQAEIERLRKERDEWAEKVVVQANAGTLFVMPNQEFETDAEIGRLVRDIVLDKAG